MIIFAALFCDGSASHFGIISLHSSKEGAEQVVKEHKEKLRQEWISLCNSPDPDIAEFWNQPENVWSDEHGTGFDAWDVQEFELLK